MHCVLTEAPIPQLAHDTMVRELLRPLLTFFGEPGATEIVINRPTVVSVETGTGWTHYDAPELTLTHLSALATAIATYTDQEIGVQRPLLSAILPDGERVQLIVPPAVEWGTISFSIRRPRGSFKSLAEYAQEGAFARYVWARSLDWDRRRLCLHTDDQALGAALEQRELAQFLDLAVRAKKNIAVVGETGSGKTTLMTSLCQSISTTERLVTIEDVRELMLPRHGNRVHLLYSKGGQGVANVTPSDLIAATLRMKPDRVLLAELRGGEAFDYLKLLTTGHSGSITSYHAESCTIAAERYVFMCKEHQQAAIYDAGTLKRLVSLTLDIILHVVAERPKTDDSQSMPIARYVREVHYDPFFKLSVRDEAALVRT